MAIVWSWAFGAESTSTMSTYFGWTFNATNFTNNAVTGTGNEYTYSGAPTKYSWATSVYRRADIPVLLPASGTVACALKADGGSWKDDGGHPLFGVVGSTDGDDIRIQVKDNATNTMRIMIRGNEEATFTLTKSAWHYVSLTYDMTATTFTAEVFVNGSSVASGSRTGGTVQAGARIRFGGYVQSGNALNAQFVAYDSATSAADAAVPYYVTRLAPNADNTGETVGSWTPSSGTDNFDVTNENPYVNTDFTTEPAPSSNDAVVTQVSNMPTQLNLPAGITVVAATNHTLSTGSGFDAHASVKDSAGSYVDGSSITPDASTADYAYATVSSGLSGSSVIDCKYEVD